MADELSRLRIERDAFKSKASDLENSLQQARNAQSEAEKNLAVAQSDMAAIPVLEEQIVALEAKLAALQAENDALLAREARASSIIEDAKALARLVDKA